MNLNVHIKSESSLENSLLLYMCILIFFFFLVYNRFFLGNKDFIDTGVIHVDDFKGIAIPFCFV